MFKHVHSQFFRLTKSGFTCNPLLSKFNIPMMFTKNLCTFDLREVIGTPSSSQIQEMKQRYLAAPLIIDPEYIIQYTEGYQQFDGINLLERRAKAHAFALSNLTPVIRDPDFYLLVGSKTRFVRGAIPYCNYAVQYVLRELNKKQQQEQDKFAEVGTGGGIAKSIELAAQGDYERFGGKFLIKKTDKEKLREIAEYWDGKCMQDVGDRFWKRDFEYANFIQNGWKVGLYTAPHDPAPEGRYVLDFEIALNQGFNNIIERMQNKIADTHVTDYESAQKIFFWRAGISALEGTIQWAKNYANAARKMAMQEPNFERKQKLLELADRCDYVPANPPRNFAEAVQAFWFIYLAGHIEGAQLGYSPGRFDQYMYSFYNADKKRDMIKDNKVLECLEALRIKMTEIEYMASFSWEGLGSGNLYQNMMLGGLDEKGRPADNKLSQLVIQSAINCQTTQPTLSVWYDDSLSQEFLLKSIQCIKTGVGFPAFFNFKVYAQHELQKSKRSLAEIRKYAAMGGCTEPTLAGRSYGIVQAGFVNNVKVFEIALNGGVDPQSGIAFGKTDKPNSYEELEKYFKFYIKQVINYWQRYWNYVMAAHHDTCNLIYSGTLIHDCIGRGKSLDDGGAICNGTPTTLSTGMVNVVNSLAAVKHIINHNGISMDQLREALKNNWEDHEELRKRFFGAPKWGNNDDEVDQIYQNIFDFYCQVVAEQKNYLGEAYDPSMLAISTHAPFGKACGATPDGRYAKETLADGVTSPFPGTDQNGPLAVLLSASKLDHTMIRGGLHNMKFLPSSLSGVQGSIKLLQLIKTYFDTNAFQIQFNVVDSKMLKDAQEHPENYRDLIVRVAGFSAFFVELGKSIQNEIIIRTKHTL